jgi:hypothetical protein
MATMRVIPKSEAQQTRMAKTPGVRRQRMDQFDEYARVLVDNPGEAVVYEDIDEPGQKFVLSLRGAFKRAGMDVSVRKMRGRGEVRAWINDAQSAAAGAKKGGGRTRSRG